MGTRLYGEEFHHGCGECFLRHPGVETQVQQLFLPQECLAVLVTRLAVAEQLDVEASNYLR